MRATLLDPEQEAHLEEHGFAVIPFMDDATLDAVEKVHRESGVAPDDPRLALSFTFHSQSAEHKRHVAETVYEIVRDCVDRSLDRHDVYLTTFITKWTGEHSGFGPHQDPTLVDEREFRGVTVWTPMQDTGRIDGVDNGMLHVVPGSHKFIQQPRVQNVDVSPFRNLHEEIISTYGVGVPTKRGEAIVFDNRLIHYSQPNMSDTPRVVLSLGVRTREGSCVLFRDGADGTLDLFEIEDDFYLDVLPAEHHLYEPPTEPIATFDAPTEAVTSEEFAEMCAATTIPECTVEGTTLDIDLNPGVFCALCGSTEGLEGMTREGRGNAQIVCPSCEARLGGRSADPQAPTAATPETTSWRERLVPRAIRERRRERQPLS